MDKEISTIVSRANAFQVVSDEQMEKATNVISWCRAKLKKVEERRKFFTGPLNDHIKSINAFFRQWTGPLEEAEQIVDRKVRAYREELRKKAEAEQRAAEQAARKKAEKKGIDPDAVVVEEAPAPAKRTDFGTFKQVADFEVQDLNQIPRSYLMADEKKIRQAVKEGIREIPGVRIFMREDFTRR